MATFARIALTAWTLAVSAAEDDRLLVEPTEIRFRRPDETAQLVVTLRTHAGNAIDLTHAPALRFESLGLGIAQVEVGGRVRSVSSGRTEIVVSEGTRKATIRVLVEQPRSADSISFVSDVVPIFTRHGCNSGSCHGKTSGQNGFRLGLLGFDPARDFESLVLEGRGRRVFPANPGESLLLKKPTAQVAHGGGQRFTVGSVEFQVLSRWIAQGSPNDTQSERPLKGLEVFPASRRLLPLGTQQLRVIAHEGNGLSVDVTRWAQFQANSPETAVVDANGRIEARGGVGVAAIVARYRGNIAVSSMMVPSEVPLAASTLPLGDNLVDRHVLASLNDLRISPSGPCTDAEFARRSSLEICGTLPDLDEVAAFVKSTDEHKRARWVDRLLERPEYADNFAMKWGAILKNKRALGPLSQPGTFGLHAWIRQAIARNMPYDRFVAAILTAQGDAARCPPVVWYRRFKSAEELADDSGQLFLGLRLQCARCHHHPAERWGQADYYGFAAFFSRIGRKPGPDPVTPRLFVQDHGTSTDPFTGKSYAPRIPENPEPLTLGVEEDPRKRLMDWLTTRDNPYFAKAIVNRYWKHFFGRGLVEPEDDFRTSNPPTHPALLEALAADFVGHGYDLKHLIRVLATSRTYDRTSLPTPHNRFDRRYYARYYPRRLPAEVLLDAIDTVSGSHESFEGLPATLKAIQVPDDGLASPFLDAFGRPKRESVCECERTSEPDLTQGLLLLGSAGLQNKLADTQGRAARWANDPRSDAEKVRELYQLAYSRLPDNAEAATCLAHLARRRAERRLREGYEDLLWTVMNTKEFLFNH